MKLSVIICTHNPRADYFARTLAALAAQSLDRASWELLIIDNCSAQPVAGRFDLAWHPAARLVREEQLGLTPARLRGIREAGGDVLVFVDDDNVLDPGYLETARRIAQQRPWLGAWSGQCRPEFEVPPAEWTRRYWGNLCIREFDAETWSNLPRLAETMPAGAGLCVRSLVARHYLALHDEGRRRFQLDRTGDALLSGGDNDLAACACDVGLGMGLVPELGLIHIIPPDRLTEDYLARLAEGIHFSGALLDAEWGHSRAARGLIGRLVDWLRQLRVSGPHRTILRAVHTGERRAARVLAATGEGE